ncbi:MAG: DUF481 domain-containing protein [Steroidobacteraceae bacterium]
MNARLLALATVALIPAVALADPAPPQGVWTGKGQAGLVASQGNTEARTGNAALDLGFLAGPWTHSLHLDALYAQSSGITSGERWDALWQTDYQFTSDFYAFGALRFERDLFSGFNYQGSASAGIGYKIFDTDGLKLSVQAGPGFRRERPQILTKDAAGAVIARALGDPTDSAIVNAGIDYSQALTATTTLSDKLLVQSGGGNTLLTNALALTVKMSTRLALSVGYNIQNNSAPPPGLKKLDSIETVNLVFSF